MRRRGCATHACARAGSTRARTLASGAWPRAFPPRAMSGAPPDPSGEGAEPSADDDDDVSRLLALDVTPTSELAAVAAARGLRDASTRARAWPKLLALDVTRADASAALFEGRATALNARERNQVELDVRRCHWIPASAGPERRARLSRVIRGVLATHPGECRYYQGMHDVAAVLLLVCGDAAPAVLDRLVVGHLRDAARGSGLDAVLETLRLLPHLIAVADPELHAAVFPASTRSPFADSKRSSNQPKDPKIRAGDAEAEVWDASSANGTDERTKTATKDANAASSRPRAKGRPKGFPEKDATTADSNDSDDSNDSFELLSVADFSEMEHVGTCHFAVSWLLTWFAHSLENLDDVSRLFDAFLGSDPLTPLYVGAAAVVADRETLLAMARGEMDETGAFVVEAKEEDVPSPRGGVDERTTNDDERAAAAAKRKNLSEKTTKKKSRAMNRAEDWPLIEGMLHARLSALPALKNVSKTCLKNDVVRLRWKVVESAGEDGGFRATVAAGLFVESAATIAKEKDRKGWGVEAVLRSAATLHARLPPRALYTVLGMEPDPFSAFAAYPYPWLAMSRWGFGADGRADFGRENEGEKKKAADSAESAESAPDKDEGGGDAQNSAPFRLGEGASATALFAQRLGANIRRGVRRGVSELKKMENSEPARGLRGFLGGAFAGGAAEDAVPRLND